MVIGVSIVFAFLLTFFLGSMLSVSYYRRWQASRLLAVVRQFHPGITTDAQARSVLKPFTGYEPKSDRQSKAVSADEVYYDFYNTPHWIVSLQYYLRVLPFRIALPWTLVRVRIIFAGGLLAEIHVVEMQEDHLGYPHPNSASVDIYSNRLHAFPPDFSGYSEHFQNTFGVDAEGRRTGFECCHVRFIELDERATPAQLSQSLNFRLHCMTSFLRCKDDRQILP